MDAMPPVLLAEDDSNEVFLMQRAFAEAEVTHPLVFVRSGQRAIEYLKGAGPYADRAEHPLPCLLLLDLRLPGRDGLEVLEWLRWQLALNVRLPVVVLTDSYNTADREQAMELGAREYVIKPYSHELRVQFVRELNVRWLKPAHQRGGPALLQPPPLQQPGGGPEFRN